uniref:Transcription factor Adf-1 n=1 Tax=Zeugodacus cucurbitae TaxID=28588 RepID=A0A0A1WG32_ZEUCU
MVTPLDDVRLIKLVQSHPILYDRNLARGPKTSSLKDDIWKKLSLQLNCSERACITRWKSIRDRFGKELRRAQDNPEEAVNWDMFEHLLFLREHYKQGQANGEAIFNIKYEPKKRKRGRKPRKVCEEESFKEDRDDDDMDPEVLIENQQLIELVKEHPVLYDKHKIRDSKNLTLKNDAWHEISETMGISEETCYKRWKKLRDRFAREYRHQKIYPERSVTWVYFQDLSFLGEHYRKGIPLPVDAIRQRKKAKMATTTMTNDETWVEDCPFLYVEDAHELQDEDMDDIDPELSEVNSNSLDELIIMPKSNESYNDVVIDESITPPANTSQSSYQLSEGTNLEEPEQKLSTVISGIQQVLEQSQDCLKSLQKQREQQMHSNVGLSINADVSMIQKVHILLDGLNLPNRTLAERRIVQFLCECQIKTLNNVDIDDVDCTQDY